MAKIDKTNAWKNRPTDKILSTLNNKGRTWEMLNLDELKLSVNFWKAHSASLLIGPGQFRLSRLHIVPAEGFPSGSTKLGLGFTRPKLIPAPSLDEQLFSFPAIKCRPMLWFD